MNGMTVKQIADREVMRQKKAAKRAPQQTMERIVSDRFVPETLNTIADVILAYRPKRKPAKSLGRTSPKQRLIDQIVQWRQQRGGSVSPHNHRRLLNTWTTSELQALWDKVQVGEGSSQWGKNAKS